MDLMTRAKAVKLIAFDIDGVMTDGGLHYTDDGQELKTFNVQDGLGLKLLQRAGITLAIITGRTSGVVAHRAADLDIQIVRQGVANKREALQGILDELQLDWQDCAFMGDDLIDLPILTRVGLAIAPANARSVVKKHVHWVTDTKGGEGAVRDVADTILAAQEKLDGLVQSYLSQ